MRSRASFLVLLLLVSAFAGCAHPSPRGHTDALARASFDDRSPRWATGDWWSYHATLRTNTTRELDLDLVVDGAHADGYRIGTNSSVGFFGLPFLGNVTRDFSPELGDETWPMYQFPLVDGATWSYHLWGHDAKATAHASVVDVPGTGPEPGFRIEAASFGQVFARYDYAPTTGWFTHLELIDPAKRETVLSADLRAFGENYRGLYFVEETLAIARMVAPGAPTTIPLDVPAADGDVRAHLSVSWTAGACDATLRDESGATLAHAQVVGLGGAAAEATAPQGAHAWTLEPRCVGSGSVYVAVTGVRARSWLAVPSA